jgi:hypothetical protein
MDYDHIPLLSQKPNHKADGLFYLRCTCGDLGKLRNQDGTQAAWKEHLSALAVEPEDAVPLNFELLVESDSSPTRTSSTNAGSDPSLATYVLEPAVLEHIRQVLLDEVVRLARDNRKIIVGQRSALYVALAAAAATGNVDTMGTGAFRTALSQTLDISPTTVRRKLDTIASVLTDDDKVRDCFRSVRERLIREGTPMGLPPQWEAALNSTQSDR